MRTLEFFKKSGIITALLFVTAGPALGQWQQQRRGQYTYWQRGYDLAFPIGNRPNWFYYSIREADGSHQWWHPEYEDPQTRVVRYLGLWTDGFRIRQMYSTGPLYWRDWENCDLSSLKNWADNTYRKVTSQAQSDFHPYYVTEHNEAQSLFAACKQMISRRGGR